MGSFKIRTDLALEARENAEEEAESLSGVSVEEVYHEDSEVRITKVSITSKNSARALGKPMGTYITLEAPAMTQQDENYHQEISGELSMQLREIIPGWLSPNTSSTNICGFSMSSSSHPLPSCRASNCAHKRRSLLLRII